MLLLLLRLRDAPAPAPAPAVYHNKPHLPTKAQQRSLAATPSSVTKLRSAEPYLQPSSRGVIVAVCFFIPLTNVKALTLIQEPTALTRAVLYVP